MKRVCAEGDAGYATHWSEARNMGPNSASNIQRMRERAVEQMRHTQQIVSALSST